jgi:putative OPT family oligopeptide transporter
MSSKFKPYVSADSTMEEITWKAIIIGCLMAAVFGAANAYLGLKVGMTVSASIPAAVVSMGILRGLLRSGTILENNIVQTIASAGESLAAGVIFTLPVLYIWGKDPSVFEITIIALLGGWIGVLFMIPLRRSLIVDEHDRLPYPEGRACSQVLIAGEAGGSKAKTVFTGLGIGAIYTAFVHSRGIHLFQEYFHKGITLIPNIKPVISFQFIPSLLGVGYIIGIRIAAYMLAGGILGWWVMMPLIQFFGHALSSPIFPATALISQMSPDDLWSNYIRYIGAGAVAMGGFISLIGSVPVILKSFIKGSRELFSGLQASNEERIRTDQDIDMKWVILGIGLFVLVLAFTPLIPVNLTGGVLIMLFSFFFVTVSSRIVGLVGSSSNPISGMTIATLLVTSILFKWLGYVDEKGMVMALIVGAVVCIASAIAGDSSQDLKTGYMVGATPWKQQAMEFLGVFVTALIIGYVLHILNQVFTFTGKELSAPQANIMALMIKGVMQSTIPWGLIFIGAAASLLVELFGIPSLAFAVGLYLPLELSTTIMIGGAIRFSVEKVRGFESETDGGILLSSGLIAGEALMGIVLAMFVYYKQQVIFNATAAGTAVTGWLTQDMSQGFLDSIGVSGLQGWTYLTPIVFFSLAGWLFYCGKNSASDT